MPNVPEVTLTNPPAPAPVPTLAAVLLAGNDAGGKSIKGLAQPVAPADAARLIDIPYVPGTPGLSSVLGVSNDAGACKIANLAAPTNPNDAARLTDIPVVPVLLVIGPFPLATGGDWAVVHGLPYIPRVVSLVYYSINFEQWTGQVISVDAAHITIRSFYDNPGVPGGADVYIWVTK